MNSVTPLFVSFKQEFINSVSVMPLSSASNLCPNVHGPDAGQHPSRCGQLRQDVQQR